VKTVRNVRSTPALFRTSSAYQRETVVCAPGVPKKGCGRAVRVCLVVPSSPTSPPFALMALIRSITSSGAKLPSS
jgi:hypothetical protein